MQRVSTFKRPTIICAILLLYVSVAISVFLLPITSIYLIVIQIAALFGYISLFLSTVLTNYVREVRVIFGKPFLSVHHWFASLGLILITVHPVMVAISAASLLVFIPDFSSWYTFWSLAGRPALYLAYIAALAGLLRNRIKRYWKYIHGFMYVVLTFAFVHGLLIGGSFQNPVIVVLFLMLLVIAYGVAIAKRIKLK